MSSDKDAAIEGYKKAIDRQEIKAADDRRRLVERTQTERGTSSIWWGTFCPMFRQAAAKVYHEYLLLLRGKSPPEIMCVEETGNQAAYLIRRIRPDGTIQMLGTLRFRLHVDKTITATTGIMAQNSSMRLDHPDREWVEQLFDQAMISALKDAAETH